MPTVSRQYAGGILRILFGWVFFWAFLDKLFGFGFATAPGRAWIDGVSPSFYFLKNVSKGPLAGFFQAIAGQPITDWLFMLGLLFVGLSLLTGIMMRLGVASAVAMLTLIYLAAFMPPANNPFVDEHIIYIVAILFMGVQSGRVLGLGKWWGATKIVKRFKLLE